MMFVAEPFAIVVVCKDRVRYLDTTLKSLSATTPRIPLYVVNDGTSNEQMIRYLTTNSSVYLRDCEYPNHLPEWQHFIGLIPNERVVRGVGDKVRVLMRDAGGISNIGYGCKLAFDETNAKYVIKIEDDMVFKKNWYDFICSALRTAEELGVLSGLRYFFGDPVLEDCNEWMDFLKQGYTGGNLLVASRKFLEKRPETFVNKILTINDNDDFWIDGCRGACLNVMVTKQSVCQHIGVNTEVKHKEYMRDGKIIKIDRNLMPPFEIASEVRNFR